MKKLITSGFSILMLSASLVGCNTMNEAGTTVSNTGRTVVDSGVGLVSGVGSAAVGVGKTAVSGVQHGVGLLVGKPATKKDMRIYRKKGEVMRNGHVYRIVHGKYVLVR